ncbi:biopolymer transporter ExbD [Thiomicrospira cyclica]|uniref:Biopolymer transport protein ExbD/TolR n=1 Tax=Thiomicrospira cyclica (strain DSM 14477 / JCM 11371 / ALM1) TaxID=717773 RepID=F6DA98_THICA|nr:biopolymer transporter ExbD [Thiomicrospira cyclica]AEG31064.1 Biopolymer transport protein ExbD/TolR [Thiomicrospira cyclica ALM1]
MNLRRLNTLQRKPLESTVALINIIFLLLIFFIVSGTIASPRAVAINPITLAELESESPIPSLILTQDGRIYYHQNEVALDELPDLVAEQAYVRLLPDRDVLAPDLMRFATLLRDYGVQKLVIVVETS